MENKLTARTSGSVTRRIEVNRQKTPKKELDFYTQALLLYSSHLHAKKMEQATVWDLMRTKYTVNLSSSISVSKKAISIMKGNKPIVEPLHQNGFNDYVTLIKSYLTVIHGRRKNKVYEPKSGLSVLVN